MAANGRPAWPCINEGAVKLALIVKQTKQVIAFECLIGCLEEGGVGGCGGCVGEVRRRIKVACSSDFPVQPQGASVTCSAQGPAAAVVPEPGFTPWLHTPVFFPL